MTLFQLLEEGTAVLQSVGSPDAAGDARNLLLAAFELDMVHFLLDRMQQLAEDGHTQSCIRHYREMVERRSRRVPLQQILGCQEFMGLNFAVNEHVLIPRQDTETLVELVLAEQKDPDAAVLDLCTGSGCIAVSLAVKGGYRTVTATDISGEALQVARHNAEVLGCAGQVHFYQGDLFEALDAGSGRRFHVITANPPYIPTGVIRSLEPEVRDHEPVLALDGTADGLHFYRRLAAEAGAYLHPGGSIYLEIGYDQGTAVSGLLEKAGFEQVRICQDLPGKDRVVYALWQGDVTEV